jgi:hypothetical protein
LTASSRLAGASPMVGDIVPEAVLGLVGSEFPEVGEGVVDRRADVGDGSELIGGPGATASAGNVRDLCSIASKTSSTTLTKTNPPMAVFGQWPVEKSGMRGSVTAVARTSGNRPLAGCQVGHSSDKPEEAR